jgi:hypothetical protein
MEEHQHWRNLAVLMFSGPGLYNRLVTDGKYPFATNPMGQPWNFEVYEADMPQLVVWFCTHGIAANSTAVRILESFARAARNHVTHELNSENTTFSEWPHSAEAVQNWHSSQITPWHGVWLPPLRTGLGSDYPIHPSTPMREREVPLTTLEPEEMNLDNTTKIQWADDVQTDLPDVGNLF